MKNIQKIILKNMIKFSKKYNLTSYLIDKNQEVAKTYSYMYTRFFGYNSENELQ